MKQLIIAILLALPFCSTAQQTINKTMTHNGVQRSYILYIPANYSSSTPAPLVFCFHGFTGSSISMKNRAAFESIADTAGFIAVYPLGTPLSGSNHWNVGGWTNTSTADDVGFTAAMIDSISAAYNINAKRIYSTGFSNGGFFSYELACQLSDKIAAIASVSGTMTDKIMNNCNPTHPTPVLQIHGTSDIVIGFNGNQIAGSKPVQDVLDYWINYNQCDTTAVVTNMPDSDPNDGSTVELYEYKNGWHGSTVELLKVNGGAHEWPGNAGNMDISASLEIWKFFSKHELKGVNITNTTNNLTAPTLYPNPSKGQTTLSFYAAHSGTTEIVITDVLGRTVWSKSINYQAGNHHEAINTQQLGKGMYLLSAEQFTMKLVIQ